MKFPLSVRRARRRSVMFVSCLNAVDVNQRNAVSDMRQNTFTPSSFTVDMSTIGWNPTGAVCQNCASVPTGNGRSRLTDIVGLGDVDSGNLIGSGEVPNDVATGESLNTIRMPPSSRPIGTS